MLPLFFHIITHWNLCIGTAKLDGLSTHVAFKDRENKHNFELQTGKLWNLSETS